MNRHDTELPQLGQWSSPEELRGLQNEQLARIFDTAAKSPFYAERLQSGIGFDRDGLETLPVTTKQDLRDNYPFGMLAVDKAELATYHESSGTAGTPTPSYYTGDDWIDLAERYARKIVPIGPDDTFLVRTPYALMITGHLAQAAARLEGATVVPGDNRSLAMPYSRVVRVLRDLEVSLTWSMPTEILLWTAAVRAAGGDPATDFPALRAFFVGGEPLSPARRARITEIWGVPVVEEFGSTETGSLAGQCERGRLHLWADRAIFEVHDTETGRIAPAGRGQLVVTPLYRKAMPLLRYDLADLVEVSWDACDCDWVLPTVKILGRAAFGYPVGDARVTQHQVEELVFSLPASYEVLFWRAQAHPDRLEVEIEVPGEHREAACGELSAAIADTLGANAQVTGVPVGTLVPHETLTAIRDVVKPRSLFGADEDWGKAILYY
ncbi:AMP-binding protein [Glycomyces sp. TRM65418]|uniref:phenylacetate--CoA ligase family protein n=1 Tax=Glycomyces sp. TRM65418 TaxID=2867006 RepID=UPI001CE61F87|nr:AMP-binding protein [Glycomyces sp. TRM65418]MCC3761596.1 AMP-binding protein [Glycomyces sp. TRM65418]QZD55692.1 AMP-binding protein [Glycomyces sp. TRM65418]